MKLLLQLHVAVVAVTASYLTLCATDQNRAEDLCGFYALVVFVLAVCALLTERRVRHARTQNRPVNP